MDFGKIINKLSDNRNVFEAMLRGVVREDYLWRNGEGKWCLLEIVCHLYDEEREDFRTRTRQALENPNDPLLKIDPQGWVEQRRYADKNYDEMLHLFLKEREDSVNWLNSLRNPDWESAIPHPSLGLMSAKMFLSNWLAHDYLHFRQITRLKFDRLKHTSGETLSYAGEW